MTFDDCLRSPTLFPACAGVGAVVSLEESFDLVRVGATGGSCRPPPGGAGGPDFALEGTRRVCFGPEFFEVEVDFLGFLNGFDGSSLDPKLTCLRDDLMPTCDKGWVDGFG